MGYQCKLAYMQSMTDEKFLRRLENLNERIRTQTQVDQDVIELGDQVEYYSEKQKKWLPSTFVGKT